MPAAGPCGPASARTLATDAAARIYEQAGSVYGCSSAGRTFRLGSSRACNTSSRIGPAALSGRMAAYGALRCGVDTGFSQVVVRRLTDGRVMHTAGATSGPIGPESFESVASLVVKADGGAAWIATARSIVRHGQAVEVHALDRLGARRLDSGGGIASGSLRLRGSTLTWIHYSRRRSATLY